MQFLNDNQNLNIGGLEGDDLLIRIKELKNNIENSALKSYYFIDKGKLKKKNL